MRAGFAAAEAGAAAHLLIDDSDLGDHVAVDGADGHHLQRARRLGAGERVTVADGQGRWRRYQVTTAGQGVLSLTADGDVREEPVPGCEIVAAPALISRNRFHDVV